MNRVYLVRHGENMANITKEFSYKKVDYDLTDKGKLQAQQTAEFFKDIRIDRLVSSPLKRAIQTAEAISRRSGIALEIAEDFREVNVGDLENMPPDPSSWGIYMQVIREWKAGNHSCSFPGGEDYHSLKARFIQGLRDLTQDKRDTSILIVGHGGIFNAGALAILDSTSQNVVQTGQNQNCSISELLIDWKGQTPVAQLVKWADCSHLSGEACDFVHGLPDYVR